MVTTYLQASLPSADSTARSSAAPQTFWFEYEDTEEDERKNNNRVTMIHRKARSSAMSVRNNIRK
jgi:hypothetical protein